LFYYKHLANINFNKSPDFRIKRACSPFYGRRKPFRAIIYEPRTKNNEPFNLSPRDRVPIMTREFIPMTGSLRGQPPILPNLPGNYKPFYAKQTQFLGDSNEHKS
ncbi:MAG: hypothetical protein ACYS1A_13050, partial [Planctomycetota bacterium]